MKQFKDKLRGTGSVFRFTLQQFFKNKGNIISLIIMLLFSTLTLPVITIINGAESKKVETSELSRVFICNSTPYSFDAAAFDEALADSEYWSNTEFSDINEVLSAPGVYSLELDEAQIFATLAEDGVGYTIHVATADESEVKEDTVSSLESIALDLFEAARYQTLNITDEQLATLMATWSYNTKSVDSYFEDHSKLGTQSALQLAYSILLMMVCTLSISYIVRSIIEEKASKLVETLMVSVQPLALIVGKVLASMAYVIIFLLTILVGYVLSYHVTGLFLEVDSMGNMLANTGIIADQMNFSPITIIAFVVSLLLGYLTFSLIAGLTASGCSTLEESEGATLGSMVLLMAGYIFSCSVVAVTAPTMIYISCLVPFLSIFCAPVHYMMGTIGFGTLALSWVLQLVIIVVLAVLCAKIYRTLIMHRGNRVTWKQMLVMFRQNTTSQE